MPIEFHCIQCQRLLRTPDDTAGQQAKCPECGAIMTIPSPGSIPPPPPPGEPQAVSSNPYHSPAGYPAAPGYVPPPGMFVPAVVDLGDVFRRTWSIFTNQLGLCFAGAAIVWLLAFFAGALAQHVAQTDGGLAGGVLRIGVQLLGVWLYVGQTIYFLKIARGETPEIADLFRGGPYYVTALGATILFQLIVLLGLVLCIIPGVIFGLMMSQYLFLIVDRRTGVIDSLALSRDVMVGNKLTLFLISMIGLSAVVLTCMLGAIVIVPFYALLTAVFYLLATGQATADMRYAPPMPYPPGPPTPPLAPGQPTV